VLGEQGRAASRNPELVSTADSFSHFHCEDSLKFLVSRTHLLKRMTPELIAIQALSRLAQCLPDWEQSISHNIKGRMQGWLWSLFDFWIDCWKNGHLDCWSWRVARCSGLFGFAHLDGWRMSKKKGLQGEGW